MKRKIRSVILFVLIFSLISGQVFYSFAESGVTLVDDSGDLYPVCWTRS